MTKSPHNTTETTTNMHNELRETISHQLGIPSRDIDYTSMQEIEKAILKHYTPNQRIVEAINNQYECSITDLEKWEYQNKTEKPVISKTDLLKDLGLEK